MKLEGGPTKGLLRLKVEDVFAVFLLLRKIPNSYVIMNICISEYPIKTNMRMPQSFGLLYLRHMWKL